jgi:hypothetical protein
VWLQWAWWSVHHHPWWVVMVARWSLVGHEVAVTELVALDVTHGRGSKHCPI